MPPVEIPMDLLERAVVASHYAYAPYSGFAVGAAAQTTDGRIFIGANMENASYGMTICAEVGALQAASTAGALADIVRMAVVGAPMASPNTGRIVTPCGRCRQLILESAHLGGWDIDIWCADTGLTTIRQFPISALLPHGFGPENLRQLAGQALEPAQ